MNPSLKIEGEIAVQLPHLEGMSNSVLTDAVKFYTHHGKEAKNQVDALAVSIHENHAKMNNIGAIIQEINNISTDKGLDISKTPLLLEKLKAAKEHGVNIPMNGKEVKTQFSISERDRLMENLHLGIDEWDKDIKHSSQKMQVLLQATNTHMQLAHQIMSHIRNVTRKMSDGIKGG